MQAEVDLMHAGHRGGHVRAQLLAEAPPQGRAALLPFCKINLKAVKPRNYPLNPTSIGEHLKKRRCELGLRQKDVALRLGLNEWTYLTWENDKSAPIISMWPRMIEFLGYYPSEAPQTLADRLPTRRRFLGVSRKRLAKLLGVDEGILAKWEKGTGRPTGRVETIEEFLATDA